MKTFIKEYIPAKLHAFLPALTALFIALGLQVVSYGQSKDDHDSHEHEKETTEVHADDHSDHGEEHGDDHDGDGDDHSAHGDHDEEGEESNVIRLTDKQLKDFGVVLEKADAAELRDETILPGEVKLNQEKMAHVSPRYSGIISKISGRLGDHVKAGQVLAELESNETLAEFKVISPIEGTIIEFHITLGESVEAGRYLYIVADLDTVWVDLDIYQNDLAHIEEGQKVVVRAGHMPQGVEGVIDYVGPVVNEDTRTGLARVIMSNADRHWKAGMFITGYVATESNLVSVAVKSSALQLLDGQKVVFVKIEDGFEPRPVRIGNQDSLFTEIISGIELGEVYASERSFIVKAQKQKSEIDPEAGHSH